MEEEDQVMGQVTGAALHKRDREDDAELTVLHYICSDIALWSKLGGHVIILFLVFFFLFKHSLNLN